MGLKNYTVSIIGYIGSDLADRVEAEYNKLAEKEVSTLTVLLASDGGTLESTDRIKTIMRFSGLANKTVLVAVGDIKSSGFRLFLECEASEKLISDGVVGMYHSANSSVPMCGPGTVLGFHNEEFTLKSLQQYNASKNEQLASVLVLCGLIDKAEEVASRGLRGGDVYFSTEDLKTIATCVI